METAYGDMVEAMHRISLGKRAVDVGWKLVVSSQQRDTIGSGDASELLKNLEKWYKLRFDFAEAIVAHNQAVARLSRAVGTQLGDRRPAGRPAKAPSSP